MGRSTLFTTLCRSFDTLVVPSRLESRDSHKYLLQRRRFAPKAAPDYDKNRNMKIHYVS